MSLKLSGRQKAVLWLGVILCLWQAYQNDHILSAAFTFVASGVVPGTNVKLSPDTVLASLPVIFLLLVLLIFRREFVRLGRGLGRGFRRGEEMAASRSNDQHVPEAPVVRIEPPASKAISNPRIKSSRLRNWLLGRAGTVAVWLVPRLCRLAYWLGYGWEWLVVHVRRLGRGLQRAARFGLRVIRVESANLARFIAKWSVRFWGWLSPYLWRFDGWLGLQLHKLLDRPRVRHYRRILREFKKTVKSLLRR